MQANSKLASLVVLAALVGCVPQQLPQIDESFPVSLKIEGASLGPRIGHDDGLTTLSWMERAEHGATLRFAHYAEGKWRDTRTVVEAGNMFVNWADMPAVTPVGDNALLAHWLAYSADGPYSYDIRMSRSNDAGETWSDPVSPHNDGTATEHGFVSLYPSENATGLIWLDGRNTPEHGMTLRGASVDAALSVADEVEIDALVCDCCQTDVAIGSEGPVAVYRNRTESEVRDIYVSRYLDGAWQEGSALANDGWVIEGCPVNGPVIGALGRLVVVAWFSVLEDIPAAQFALSDNGGRTFSKPVELVRRSVTGQMGLAIIDEDSFVVSWMESDRKKGYNINLQARTTDGQAGVIHTVGKTNLLRTVPQLVRRDDELLMAWSDAIGDETQVVSVRLKILGYYD